MKELTHSVNAKSKKTLFNQLCNTYPDDDYPVSVFCADDIKKALKEFIEVLNNQGELSCFTRQKAKEIFGDELLNTAEK